MVSRVGHLDKEPRDREGRNVSAHFTEEEMEAPHGCDLAEAAIHGIIPGTRVSFPRHQGLCYLACLPPPTPPQLISAGAKT